MSTKLNSLRFSPHGIACVALTTLLLISGCAKPPPVAVEPATAEHALNPAEVERWADDVFGKMLAEHRVSGLAIAVTQGDKVVLTKGYGYADWATKTPVVPDQTQFRIGSLTKTFLATAVAQLLEGGQIASLDDPVNKYLKRLQLKQAFGKDVTIWDLLTHQGGLGNAPVFVPETDAPRPEPPLPAELIAAQTPDFVREPGTISVYCNPCSATLGFMVEDITGQTLADYLRENVFLPLGMTNTVLTNASEPGPNMVVQYAFVPNAPPVPLPYPAISPYISYAGDMNSTAADMAKWLIAHIEKGGGGESILAPETFELMHRRQRGNHPDTSGFGMKFFTYDYNGERVLEHYGSIRHRSLELMMLDRKIGVFVTMAGGGEPEAQARTLPVKSGLTPITGPVEPALSHSGARALILEHFLGPLPVQKDMTVDVSKYTGAYRNIARMASAPQAGPDLTIEDSGDGGLVIDGRGVYRPSGPDTFTLDRPLEPEAGFGVSNRYVFVTDASGKVTRMFGHVNAGGYEKMADK